jgi:hypothetical protein
MLANIHRPGFTVPRDMAEACKSHERAEMLKQS